MPVLNIVAVVAPFTPERRQQRGVPACRLYSRCFNTHTNIARDRAKRGRGLSIAAAVGVFDQGTGLNRAGISETCLCVSLRYTMGRAHPGLRVCVNTALWLEAADQYAKTPHTDTTHTTVKHGTPHITHHNKCKRVLPRCTVPPFF